MGWDWNCNVTCDGCGWRLQDKVFGIYDSKKRLPLINGGGVITTESDGKWPAWCPTCQERGTRYMGSEYPGTRFDRQTREEVKRQYWLSPTQQEGAPPVSGLRTHYSAATSGGATGGMDAPSPFRLSAATAIPHAGAAEGNPTASSGTGSCSTNDMSAVAPAPCVAEPGAKQLAAMNLGEASCVAAAVNSGGGPAPRVAAPGACHSAAVNSAGVSRAAAAATCGGAPAPCLAAPGAHQSAAMNAGGASRAAEVPATSVPRARGILVEGDSTDASGIACGGTNDTSQGGSQEDVLVMIQDLNCTHQHVLALLQQILARLPPR
jgi:hypothetical protein